MADLNAQMQRLQRAADDAQTGGEVEELRKTVDELQRELEATKATKVSLLEAAEGLKLRVEHTAVNEEHAAPHEERIMELTAEVERLKLEVARKLKLEAGDAALLPADGHLDDELKMRSEEAVVHKLAHKEKLKMRGEQVVRQAERIMELPAELELLKSKAEEAVVLLADGDEQLCAATALVEEHVLALQEALEETQKEVQARRDAAQMLSTENKRVVAELQTATEALQLARMQIAELEQMQAQATARSPQTSSSVDAYANSPTNSSTISHTNLSTNLVNSAAVRENGHQNAGARGTYSGKSRLWWSCIVNILGH